MEIISNTDCMEFCAGPELKTATAASDRAYCPNSATIWS